MRTKKDTLGNIQIHDTQRAIKYTVSPVVGVPMPSIRTGYLRSGSDSEAKRESSPKGRCQGRTSVGTSQPEGLE